jgi:hypothetical protein
LGQVWSRANQVQGQETSALPALPVEVETDEILTQNSGLPAINLA